MRVEQQHLFLYGPPASGKTTHAKRIAEQLGLPLVEVDAEIEAEAGRTIPEIFAAEGEAAFRAREARMIRALFDKPRCVVSLGGGALLDSELRREVEAMGHVVCLMAGAEYLEVRASGRPGYRPLLTTRSIHDLMAERAPHYATFERQVNVEHHSKKTNAAAVQAAFGVYRIYGMDNDYEVYVRNGILKNLSALLRPLKLGRRAALVCDTNTHRLYAAQVEEQLAAAGLTVKTIAIPAGEATKTIDTVQQIWNGFLAGGIERGDTVFALGGGVVGDLTGFAAATWLRGVDWVNIPTTMLAMVDSSLGGKTGADLPQAKNLIGAFHAPVLVVTDPEVLATLPPQEFACGMAETIKHAVIDDAELFELLCRKNTFTPAELQTLIARSLAVKVRVICEDPYEQGIRAALNLGHTIGHGVEQAANFSIPHGEAVAIGLVAAVRYAVQKGLAKQEFVDALTACLHLHNLPTGIPEQLDKAAILEAVRHDKKKADGAVRFALPVAPGEVKVGIPLTLELRDGALCIAE